MKRFLSFLLGMIVGALLCLVVLFYVDASEIESDDNVLSGLTLFEEPGDCISTQSFRVIQVDQYGNALAREKSGNGDLYLGLLVLFLADENVSYYDDQIIKVPSESCVKQLGTYRYFSGPGTVKTVPAVAIMKE